jgi:hypothetical protein
MPVLKDKKYHTGIKRQKYHAGIKRQCDLLTQVTA